MVENLDLPCKQQGAMKQGTSIITWQFWKDNSGGNCTRQLLPQHCCVTNLPKTWHLKTANIHFFPCESWLWLCCACVGSAEVGSGYEMGSSQLQVSCHSSESTCYPACVILRQTNEQVSRKGAVPLEPNRIPRLSRPAMQWGNTLHFSWEELHSHKAKGIDVQF